MSRFRTRLLAVALLAVLVLPAGARAQDFPAVEGWEPVSEVRTYFSDNLWEYINGAAELFVSYDVAICQTCDLAAGDMVATVDLYDMGTPLNAWGIYLRERPEPGPEVVINTTSVLSLPWQALLLKGSTYAKVNVLEGELSAETGGALLRALAAALPGSSDLPPERNLLPERGRETGSEGYQREGFSGRPELRQCLYADYAGRGEQTFTGFVIVDTAEQSAASVFAGLSEGWEPLEYRGGTAVVREIPFQGFIGIVRTENAIIGATGAPDRTELAAWLDLLIPRSVFAADRPVTRR